MRQSFFAVFISLFATQCSAPDTSTMLQRIDREVRTNAKVYETLAHSMKTTGHRLTGSKNGEEAEDYAFALFKSYGFENVRFHPFEVETWSRGEVSLSLKGRDGAVSDVSVISLAHAPVAADITAEIVDVGNGLTADFEAKKEQIKGKIAFCYISILPGTEGENLHRSEKTKLAIDYGALGIIIFNQVPGGVLLTGTASVTGKLISIPAVCIGYEDGMELKAKLANETVSATIIMNNFSELIKARNVIATLKGSDFPDEKIIVGGHLDSWDLSTGAIDNGIGAFSVIDIARTFKVLKIKPKRTIEFVMWMGEEQGLLGSRDYVRVSKENGTMDQIKYILNLDSGTNPRGISVGGRPEAHEFFKEIGNQIANIDTAYHNALSNRAGLHSDHQPFMLEGVPYFSLMGGGDPAIYDCYHADCDDIRLVDKDHLENNVRRTAMALYLLAVADVMPAQKLDDAATKKMMEEQGLKLKLKIAGDWRWED